MKNEDERTLESIAASQPKTHASRYNHDEIGAVIHFTGLPVFFAGCMQYGLRLVEKYPSESMPRWMPESLIAAGLGLMLGGAYWCIKSMSNEQARNREHIKKMYEQNPKEYAFWYAQAGFTNNSKRGDKHA